MDACPYAVAVVCMLCSGVKCPTGWRVRPGGRECGPAVGVWLIGLWVCAHGLQWCAGMLSSCPPVEDAGDVWAVVSDRMSSRRAGVRGESDVAWMVPVGARGRGPACSRPDDAGGMAVSVLVGADGLKRETCCCSNDWPWAWQRASPGVSTVSSLPGLADAGVAWSLILDRMRACGVLVWRLGLACWCGGVCGVGLGAPNGWAVFYFIFLLSCFFGCVFCCRCRRCCVVVGALADGGVWLYGRLVVVVFRLVGYGGLSCLSCVVHGGGAGFRSAVRVGF